MNPFNGRQLQSSIMADEGEYIGFGKLEFNEQLKDVQPDPEFDVMSEIVACYDVYMMMIKETALTTYKKPGSPWSRLMRTILAPNVCAQLGGGSGKKNVNIVAHNVLYNFPSFLPNAQNFVRLDPCLELVPIIH